MIERLTVAQFRALAKARGYTLAQLAELWQLSPGRISQVAGDPERPIHFDYALWGLPPTGQHRAVTMRRRSVVASLTVQEPKKLPKRFDVEQHWHDVTQLGMGFTSSIEFSDDIPEGALGIVVNRGTDRNNPLIALKFETGYTESFPLSYLKAIDCPLWPTLKRVSAP